MKKIKLWLIITVVLINVTAYIYEVKFNTCSSTTWAWAERLIEVCTDATVKLSQKHDKLTVRQQEISAKANQHREVRDAKVSKINDKIKKDLVFQKGQK